MLAEIETLDPRQYQLLTGSSYLKIAEVCGVEYATVRSWFIDPRAKGYRKPSMSIQILLALHYKLNYANGTLKEILDTVA